MSDSQARPPPVRLGALLAVTAGNAMEFYDFLAYAFFAIPIGESFFPSSDPEASLLASLATFGAGFLMRPVGALVIGRFGDRAGRKPAMIASFALMGVAMAGLALTPSRAVIGVAAPWLAVGWRLLQGFALGGEVGPSTAFMAEAVPPEQRGRFVALQAASQQGAVFVTGVMGLALSNALQADVMEAWGWRIAFLAGAAVIPLGVFLRAGLSEPAPTDGGMPAPTGERREMARPLALGLVMLAGGTTATYVINYLTTYARATLKMAPAVAYGGTMTAGLFGVLSALAMGALSDRLGRKPVMMTSAALLLAAAVPAFWAMLHFKSPLALWTAAAVLSTCSAGGYSVVLCALTETLPRAVRSGALGLVYALAISVFGGSTQFMVAWISHATGNPLTPAWYMAGGTCLALAAMSLMVESAPARRR